MAYDKYSFANKDGIYKDEVFEGNPSWKETLIIFAKNKGAVFGLIFVLIMGVLAIWGPNFNSYTYDEVMMEAQNMPPRIPGLE